MDMTTTEIGLVCIAMVIAFAIPFLTYLLANDKLGKVRWTKDNGFDIEPMDKNEDTIILSVIDSELDIANKDFKRKMFDVMFQCFHDVESRKHAVYMIGINHIMSDIYVLGYSKYIQMHQDMGEWNDADTVCFSESLLLNLIILIEAKLESFYKISRMGGTASFRQITQDKIQKHTQYLDILNQNAEKLGLISSISKNTKSSIITPS